MKKTTYLLVLLFLSTLSSIKSPAPLLTKEIRSQMKVIRWTERVSIASDSTEGNGRSISSDISASGRYIVFVSSATNLVNDDTINNYDVFVRDRQAGTTERVSNSADGSETYGSSSAPAISGNGRYVAFQSASSDLIVGDINHLQDIFVHDRQTNLTDRVSIATNGTESNGISSNPAISADGRYIAFSSGASNLVADDTNEAADIFVHDRQTDTTVRVSVSSNGFEGDGRSWLSVAISANGRYIAFRSAATNLVDGDTNHADDIFVHDLLTKVTERVSVASDGTQANYISEEVAISADGRYVAFSSWANNLVDGDVNIWQDTFVHDRQTGITELISVASDGTQANDEACCDVDISAYGRYVVFLSLAKNLVDGDTGSGRKVFLHDRQTGTTELVSVATNGTEGVGGSDPSISAQGTYIAFLSWSPSLVSGDTNHEQDVFLRVHLVVDYSVYLPTISVP